MIKQLKFFPILFLFLTTCTLQDQDQYSGISIVTGVSPYEEKGIVEICIGYHRIASPETYLGGFCQKLDAPSPALCSTNSNCTGRELCVCGRCSVKFCTRTDDCPEGTMCDFNNSRCVQQCDYDCDCPGPNPRCDLGMCQQMCIVDAECQTGELCALSRARCITVPCSMDGDCYADEECIIQMEPRVLKEPSPLKGNDGFLYMWVEMDQGTQARKVIFRARSVDGENWKMVPASPVLLSDINDGYRVAAPSVIYLNNQYIMYFEVGDGSSIGRAVSTDGKDWVRDSQPVITPANGEFSVHSPCVVKNPYENNLMLYYQVGNGVEIKVTTSVDAEGTTFPSPLVDLNARRTVLRPHYLIDPMLWRKVTRVLSPFVIVEKDSEGTPVFRMWVSAKGYESAEASSFGTVSQVRANLSIGYLASYDGIGFSPYPFNPIFDRIAPNSFVNHESELSPAILIYNNKYFLFYGIADADETEYNNLGFAVNPPRHSYPDSL
jgi:hypothetical protein